MDKIHDRLKGLSDEYADLARDEFDDVMQRVGSRCESPIELLLLAAFVVEQRENSPDLSISYQARSSVAKCPWPEGALLAQAELGEYRVDFYIEMWTGAGKVWLGVVVECDGHDYHERTKQQARRDKRRDRWMALNGITVLRFTGSEIWEDPRECANQVINLINQRHSEEAERDYFGTPLSRGI